MSGWRPRHALTRPESLGSVVPHQPQLWQGSWLLYESFLLNYPGGGHFDLFLLRFSLGFGWLDSGIGDFDTPERATCFKDRLGLRLGMRML